MEITCQSDMMWPGNFIESTWKEDRDRWSYDCVLLDVTRTAMRIKVALKYPTYTQWRQWYDWRIGNWWREKKWMSMCQANAVCGHPLNQSFEFSIYIYALLLDILGKINYTPLFPDGFRLLNNQRGGHRDQTARDLLKEILKTFQVFQLKRRWF